MTTERIKPEQLVDLFLRTFGSREQTAESTNIRVFFAPGRVNLIGEHTDYTGGYVFPAALTVGTWAVVRPRRDGQYRFASTHFDKLVACHTSHVVYKQEDDWANYPKGVLRELMDEGMRDCSVEDIWTGADILYEGNIPSGAGLSSSASIELVTAVALTAIAGVHMPMIELVKLCQRTENHFVGVNCGIMDQFAVGMGKSAHAVMLNCETLDYQYVPFSADGFQLIITNTNKHRGLANSKYNERRRECEAGLQFVQKQLPDVQTLGSLRYTRWERIREKLTAGAVRNRLEHVVSENERVLAAVACLQHNDLQMFGQLMKESHVSLRDLYDVTGRELDALYEAACQVDGCIGTRMTGAGFGGCTVSLVREDRVDLFKERVSEVYTEKTGLTPSFYTCSIGDGAREITQEVQTG